MPQGPSTYYTVTHDNVPFRVPRNAFRSAEEAQKSLAEFAQADPETYKQYKGIRLQQLDEMGLAPKSQAEYATEGMGAGDKFLVGAGRSLSQYGRGLGDAISGRPGRTDAQIQSDRDTFSLLDNQGMVGWEDLGEALPEMAAFMLPGGGFRVAGATATGLAAGLGAARETKSTESRTKNAVSNAAGVLAGLGIAGALFKPAAAASKQMGKMAAGIKGLVTSRNPKSAKEAAEMFGSALSQAQIGAKSADDALQQVSKLAQNRLETTIKMMGTQGQQNAARGEFVNTVRASLKDGQVDLGKVSKYLFGRSNSELTKKGGLGKYYGTEIKKQAALWDEIAKLHPKMPYDDVLKVTSAVADDKVAQVLARKISQTKEPKQLKTYVNQLLFRSIPNTGTMNAGEAFSEAPKSATPWEMAR